MPSATSSHIPHRRAAGPRRPARAVVLAAALLAFQTAADGSGADPNILEARTRVAEMVDQSMEMLKGKVAIEGVEGWAVFSGDRLPPDLDLGPGVGMAEALDGENWFLTTGQPTCLAQGHRYALVFGDEDLFREFRQGQVSGETLEQIRAQEPQGRVLAFRFRPSDQPRLEPVDLSGCRFALHTDLQRALVAKPSRTEGLVDDDVDDN